MMKFNPQLLCINCHNVFSPSEALTTNTWCSDGDFCPECESEDIRGFNYEEEIELHLTYLALEENGQFEEPLKEEEKFKYEHKPYSTLSDSNGLDDLPF
jgi:hypothetical protein